MNGTLKTLYNLRSIHGNFSDKEVSDEDLNTIMNACVQAATASARQSYSIVVVEDKKVMKSLGYVGSKILIFCVDFTRLIDLAEHLGYEFGKNGLEQFITGSTDTILVAQTAAIAAKSLEIDSLFTNCVHRGDIARVYRLLELPEEYCFPLIALVLGYPKKEPDGGKKGRLNGPGVIHFGKYHRLTTEEREVMIQEYDDPETHFLSLISHWRERGYDHYLEYFFGKWIKYPKRRSNGETKEQTSRQASQIAQLMRRAGFLIDVSGK